MEKKITPDEAIERLQIAWPTEYEKETRQYAIRCIEIVRDIGKYQMIDIEGISKKLRYESQGIHNGKTEEKARN